MSRTVCYVRVSTQEQAQHGVSLDAQEARLRSYCAAMGLEPVLLIREEGVSAGKPLALRPGGQKLLQSIQFGGVTNVVALKLDRLFRSTEDALNHVTAWDQQGVTLHMVDMGGQNLSTGTAMGRMMLTLLASFAEFERNLISERTTAALHHKKRKGEAYNHAPYGFDKIDKQLVPSESEQKVLKHIFQWRKEGLSLYKVACRLNELGVKSKTGGTWHQGTVARIVTNDLYRTTADNLIPLPPNGKRKRSPEEKMADQVFAGMRGSPMGE